MKSFYKIITLALLMLGLFSVSSNVLAVEEKVEILYENKAELVATVNIYGSKILSQKNNIFDISFVLSNGKIMQPGVKYSVLLIKNTDNGQFVVDEKVYEEVVDLPMNTSITKNINYIAPSNLEGEFTLYLQSKNDKGMTFAISSVGKVELKSEYPGLNILNETCYLKVPEENKEVKYMINQGVDILENESIKLFCMAENKSNESISVTPNFETFYRSLYGNKVEQVGGDTESISFNAGEKKEISMALPKATAPQAYDVKVSLSNDQIKSNSIVVHYVLKGPSATIQNLSLDKDYYQKDEKIEISFLWSTSADNFPGTRYNNENKVATYAEINVVSKNGRNCIEKPLFKELSLDFTNPKILYSEISKTDCVDPMVSVSLVDSDGNIFDQKSFEFETKTKIPFKTDTKAIILIIALALIVLFFLLRKKKNNIPSVGIVSFLLGIMIFSWGFFSFTKNANADTFSIGGGTFWAEVYVSWQGPNGNYFEPDEVRPVIGKITIASCGNPIQAELHTGSTYLITKDLPDKITYLEGSATLSPDSNVGSSNERFDAQVINDTTKQPISGYTLLDYYIVGLNNCCDSYYGCCTANMSSDYDNTDPDFYKWRCPGVNFPGYNTYPTSEVCTYPKDKSVSCNYLDAWKDHANNVSEYYYEDYAPTAPNDYCKNGTASNISRSFDSFNNQIVSYTCTGADSTTVECSVPLRPAKTQCYSGEINATFYSDLSNCNGEICVDGAPSDCYGGESYGYYYWHCPTGNNYEYPFDHSCNLPYEENQEYLLPDPECNNTSIGDCVNGEPANLNTTDPSNYTWNCLPIPGVTTAKIIPPCVISKSKLIGDLRVTPKECLIPFFEWDAGKRGCTIELDWSFFGPNASNVEGKVFLKDATDNSYSKIDSNLSQNGSGVFWTITKDSNIALLSTYKDANSSYSKVIGLANIDTNYVNVQYYVYDIESVKIVKQENQKPIPYVEMKNGPAEIQANTLGQFVIWATDEDPIPNNNNHDVTFQIDWDNNGTADQNVPPMAGGNYTWVAVNQKVDFSSEASWADAPGEKCFQYKAYDYYDQTVGSSWKKFCVKILDPNAPTGEITADGCTITDENGTSCNEDYSWKVINPVPEKWSAFYKATSKLYEGPNILGSGNFDLSLAEGDVTLHLYHNNTDGNGLHVQKIVKAICGSGLTPDASGTKCVKETNTLWPDLKAYDIEFPSNVILDPTNLVSTPVLAKVINHGGKETPGEPIDNTFYFCRSIPCDRYNDIYNDHYIITGVLAVGDPKLISGSVLFKSPDDLTDPDDPNDRWYVVACTDTDQKAGENPDGNPDPEADNCTEPKPFTVVPVTPVITDKWEVWIDAKPKPFLFDGRSGTISWKIDQLGTIGTCVVKSDDDPDFTGGTYTQSSNGIIAETVDPKVIGFPQNTSTTYKYYIKCSDGSIVNGTSSAELTVIKPKEIEN